MYIPLQLEELVVEPQNLKVLEGSSAPIEVDQGADLEETLISLLRGSSHQETSPFVTR